MMALFGCIRYGVLPYRPGWLIDSHPGRPRPHCGETGGKVVSPAGRWVRPGQQVPRAIDPRIPFMLSKTNNRSAGETFKVTIAAKPLRLHDVTNPKTGHQGRDGVKYLPGKRNLKPVRVTSAAHT